MTLLFQFGCPLPAAEMRLQCRGTPSQVLDCKGVYCSAHNAAVPSGIRDSESVGPDQTRIRPNTAAGQKRRRLSWHPELSPNQLRRPRQRRPPRWRRRARYRPCHPRRRRRRRPRCRRWRLRRPGAYARAGGSAGYNTQNKPSRGCTCRMLRCTNGLLDKSSCSIRVSRSIEWGAGSQYFLHQHACE